MQHTDEEINLEHDYLLWKEWYTTTWLQPTPKEEERRQDEVDSDGLPFDYLKVYS